MGKEVRRGRLERTYSSIKPLFQHVIAISMSDNVLRRYIKIHFMSFMREQGVP